MLKNWLLRIHRWTTIVFSVPLAILIVTGLILSFEPVVVGAGSTPLPLDRLEAILQKHDPDAKARSLVIRSYAGTLSIAGGENITVDIASGEKAASPGALAVWFTTSRRLHETLQMDLRWLVSLSTAAMLFLMVLGILMGWPRLRNSLAGWHKGTAWFLLPLLIASPLTGLFLAYGITFTSPSARAPGGAALPLREAVLVVARAHDLSKVTWIRPRGSAMLARVNDNGEMRVFAVGREGLVPTARNWPRLIHEGNWSGALSAGINVVTSIAFVLLMTTGLLIWGRRTFRRRAMRAARA
jgi:uncharacterized iron-regulated membrane protein